MKNKKVFQKVIFIVLIALILLSLVAPAIFSQARSATPHQEKLLNGLKILMWPDAAADKVRVRVRVHAGSAFDPQGKEGVMRMLADNIFPDAATKEFFAEDLAGSLNVYSNYDYIEVDAIAKPDSLLSVLETLSTAISNPTIDKEQTAKLRTRLIAELTGQETDPDILVDAAAAKRLLGTFPYGRPVNGTTASVKTIDFADLIDVKQRFLTADNATLAISGNFDRTLALRAMRRYFGSWLKSDRRTPSTFRAPDDPTTEVLVISPPKPEAAPAVRAVFRASSRADKDHAASQLFGRIVNARLKTRLPAGVSDSLFVRNNAHVLPGVITIGWSPGKNDASAAGKVTGLDVVTRTLAEPVTEAELQPIKAALRDEWSKYDAVAAWLDVDTYKIAAADHYTKSLDATTLSDVNAYAEKFRKQPMAVVYMTAKPAS